MLATLAEGEKPNRTTATLVLDLEPDETTHKLPRATQQAGEYKKHSLAAGYWGDIRQSKRPIRQVAAEEAQATFLRGLLDAPMDHRQRNPADWIVSLALHILIVSSVIIVPLAFTQAIDLRHFQLTYLTVPRPPAAAPPSAPAAVQQLSHMIRRIQSALTAPIMIPKRIEIVKEPAPPEINPEGVMGGIAGGETSGVLGGILGGAQHSLAPPPPPPLTSKQKVYRVGGIIKPPRPITLVDPVYPLAAQIARAEGVVEVDAILDERGNVIEARAVSGPGLLMAAAAKAVSQWKYEPTYLDGVPVAIRMEVRVNFHLR